MSGFHGPIPKANGQRARRNRDALSPTTLVFERGSQPALPEDEEWPEQTRRWWAAWAQASIAEHLTDLDWQYLRATAVLHRRLWRTSSTEAAKELRLREEAFGVTVAARLRLRIQWAEADEVEERRGSRPVSSRDRRGGLRAVGAEERSS